MFLQHKVTHKYDLIFSIDRYRVHSKMLKLCYKE